MLNSGIPNKLPTPWGAGAGAGFIRSPSTVSNPGGVPIASQIGINPGFASWLDGFVPLNFSPVGAGGIPPFGQDMNSALNVMSAWLRWAQAGGAIPYDSTFSGAIGGYPQGAVVQSTALIAGSTLPIGRLFMSLVDNNTNNPDSVAENWTTLGLAETGDFKWRPTGEALPGWVIANATTIGSAASGASQLAAARAQNLYCYLWSNFSQSQCPVSGGRGASAILDFGTANKPMAVFDMRGYVQLGMDIMQGAATTRLTGVPVTTGNATTAGSLLGEALHAMIAAENGQHTHGTTEVAHHHTSVGAGATNAASGGAQSVPQTANTGDTSTGLIINTSPVAATAAHNTTQLGVTGTFYIKL